MAIAFDNAGGFDTQGTPATEVAANFTITGANPTLVIGVLVFNASDVLTAFTFNGVTVPIVQKTLFNTDRWLYLGVLAPAPAGVNLAIDATVSIASNIAVVLASYTGTNPTEPDNSNIGTTSSAASRTSSLTPLTDHAWVVEIGSAVGVPVGASTGITQRAITGDLLNGSSFYRLLIGDSNAPISPPAATSMTITGGSTGDLASAMASLAPSVLQSAGGWGRSDVDWSYY